MQTGGADPLPDIPDELEERILAILDRLPDDDHEQAIAELLRAWPNHGAAVRLWLDRARGSGIAAPAAGQRFGPYHILRLLGRGGMGIVYLAREEALDRLVALKILPWHFADDPERMQRFQREARAVAQLRHPRIVPVFAVGELDGTSYFSMEYVVGRTLHDVLGELRRSGVPAAESSGALLRPAADAASISHVEAACRIVLDVSDALAHAHERGIVHRDVKPSNIMLRPDGEALLFDFGLARLVREAPLTRTGAVLGTPYYAAPEQLEADQAAADARTDVYALGVTLFELLTLQVPFTGTLEQVLHQIERRNPPLPRRLNARVPRDLETVCLTAMDKARSRRYASAADFAADLRRFLEGRSVVARPVGAVTRTLRWVRRNPAASAALALALIVAIGIPTAIAVTTAHANQRLRQEQAHTAFGKARLAAQRGLWQEALAAYDEAERAGYRDPLEIAIGRIDAWQGMLDNGRAIRLADALLQDASFLRRDDAASRRHDQHLAKLLLIRGDMQHRLVHADAGLAQMRQALDSGLLDDADRCYAQSFFAESVPQVRRLLEEVLAHDPWHLRASSMLLPILFVDGDLDAMHDLSQRMHGEYPDDPNPVLADAGRAAALGDLAHARALVEGLRTRLSEDALEVLTDCVEMLAEVRRTMESVQMSILREGKGDTLHVLKLVMPPVQKLLTLVADAANAEPGGLAVNFTMHPVLWRAYQPLVATFLARAFGAATERDMIETMSRTLECDPDMGLVLFLRGNLRGQAGDMEGCETDYRAVLERHGPFTPRRPMLLALAQVQRRELAALRDPAAPQRPQLVKRAHATVLDLLAYRDLELFEFRLLADLVCELGDEDARAMVGRRWHAAFREDLGSKLLLAMVYADEGAERRALELVEEVLVVQPRNTLATQLREVLVPRARPADAAVREHK